ncbi:hypothetical protein [Hyphomicrobium sp. 99]|uniref:hypothetical protein n=1 Tax=Hyphomicrobium sp. 99 TaxID=1163419 RepID=UPI001FDAB2A0|nr:hypothetical protein [Hyphomicrobium sp. 99]
MAFAIKAEISDASAKTFVFAAQKMMYGGKQIAEGDTAFVFASENEGGQGLIARGVVVSAEALAKKPGLARQTPLVSLAIRVTARAKRLRFSANFFSSCELPINIGDGNSRRDLRLRC